MKKEIRAIKEAYSMQPETYRVGLAVKVFDGSRFKDSREIYEIKLVGENYEGYDVNGNILFKCRFDSVNVMYV